MADSLNGIGGQRSSGPTTIPGRARTISNPNSRDSASTSGQRERASSRTPAERQFINLDGRSFDLNAPRGSYVNLLV